MGLQDVLDDGGVGRTIYGYLRPKELCALGSCSRRLRENVRAPAHVVKICADQLPLHLGEGTNYLSDFREGCSFSDKEELLDHVLEKAEEANLVVEGAGSMEDSRRMAREELLGEEYTSRSFVTFHPLDDGSTASPSLRVTVECRWDHRAAALRAGAWKNHILRREAFGRSQTDRETRQLVEEWLDCLLSLNDGSVSFRMWGWSLRHPTLNGRGIMGLGVVIAVGDGAEEARGNSTTILEVRLTRLY